MQTYLITVGAGFLLWGVVFLAVGERFWPKLNINNEQGKWKTSLARRSTFVFIPLGAVLLLLGLLKN